MHFNKRNLLDSLLIAAIIGLLATLARGADTLTLAERIQRAEAADTAKSLEDARELERQIKADAQAARLAHERQPYSVRTENFIVSAVGRYFSEGCLRQAEGTRNAYAWHYHKRAMVDGEEFTIIQIEVNKDAQESLDIWLCGKGRLLRGDNRIWITAKTRERAARILEEAVEAVVRGSKPRVTERAE